MGQNANTISEESPTDPRSLYHLNRETGAITFTVEGIRTYKTRLARGGFDIRKIRTGEQFREALEATESIFLGDLEKETEGCSPEFKAIVDAIFDGDDEKMEMLNRKAEARERAGHLGLKVVV